MVSTPCGWAVVVGVGGVSEAGERFMWVVVVMGWVVVVIGVGGRLVICEVVAGGAVVVSEAGGGLMLGVLMLLLCVCGGKRSGRPRNVPRTRLARSQLSCNWGLSCRLCCILPVVLEGRGDGVGSGRWARASVRGSELWSMAGGWSCLLADVLAVIDRVSLFLMGVVEFVV